MGVGAEPSDGLCSNSDVILSDANNLNRPEVTATTNLLRDEIQSEASSLLSKIYSKPGTSRKLAQEYVVDTSLFLSNTVSSIEDRVRSKLIGLDVDPAAIDDICSDLLTLKEPFADFDTEHKRLVYLKNRGFYIPPIDYNVGPDMFSKMQNGKVIFELANAKAVFVPLREVLKAFMELPNVFDIITDFMNTEPSPDVVSEYIHCSHWTSKRRSFDANDLVLPYHKFFDEYEVDKDLGSHSAKLGAVYIKLACLPPEFQGDLDNIFLALIFNNADRKDYSLSSVYKILVSELNFLQNEGIEINVSGKTIRVFFVLGLACGDNLGLHILLNFSESFSANYCCRFCYVQKEVLQRMVVEDVTLLRDEARHKRDVELGSVQRSGVAGPSALAAIDHFRTTDNPFVDLMHDLDEGVAVYDMQHILYHFIFVKHYFDVETLNFALTTFQYSPDISNRPPQFSERRLMAKSINMTAAEMRTFVRIFSLLIGDLIDEGDDMWALYLLLRDIYDLVLCSSVQRGVSTILRNKIAAHHLLYLKVTGDTLKPKHHFLIHYPRILLSSGPFPKYSCQRFEANHQLAIQDAKATKSRRFIAHTIAVKQQLRLAYRLQTKQGLYPKLEVGSEKSNFHFDTALPKSFNCFMQHSFANVKGTTFKRNVCVVVDASDDDGPKFGVISDVLVNKDGEVGLVYEVLSIVSFSYHFHAYEVRKQKAKRFVAVEDLFDHHPVLFNKATNGKLYVTLHHLL